MLSSRAIRRWSFVHTWSSLVCTLFLLMLCLTGLPLIFHDEIDALTGDEPVAAAMPEGTPDVSLDMLGSKALALHPDRIIRTIFYDPDAPHVVKVGLVKSMNAPPDTMHFVAMDSRTANVLGEDGQPHGVMNFMLVLHTEMFAGLPGTLFLGLMGLLFVLALVSGVVLYAPFMRRLPFGTVRKTSTRTRWLDLHNLTGAVALLWILVVGLSGVMNTLARPLFGLWTMQSLPPLLAPYAGQPLPATLTPVQGVVDSVRARLPDMEVTSVIFPTTQYGSPRHYVVWTRGREPVTSRLFTPVLADAQNGRLAMAHGLPWYLRALEVSRPLHFGDYGGLLFKLAWALLDIITIAVLWSGLALWFKRRRGARP
jgi:uncharacterized iron-regulated membrane protein